MNDESLGPAAGNVRVVAAVETEEGAGARVNRLMPTAHLMHLDPFVFLDHFDVRPPAGFPPHPHRGFEIVTYMLEGGFRHWDDGGHEEVITAGGAQRVTAGRGIVHSEMPATPERNTGLQLWINLPRQLKGIEPEYQSLSPDQFPEEEREGVRIRQVVGGASPVRLHTEVVYLDVTMEPGGGFLHEVTAGSDGFIYVLEGEVSAGDRALVPAKSALVFHGGPRLSLETGAAARFVLVYGRPHGEPIRMYGPYVD